MNEFKNDVVNQIDLPEIKELDFKPIPETYLLVMFIATGIFFSLLAIGIGVLIYFSPEFQTYSIQLSTVWLSLLLLSVFLKFIQFKKMGYIVREKDIIFRRGVLAINSTIVPFNRVQHVMINEGVIMRMYGLASIKIFTAGGSKSDLSINGLRVQDAMEIKDFITRDIKENPLVKLESTILDKVPSNNPDHNKQQNAPPDFENDSAGKS
jgi:membrane protein YdbS with pleckstrin-like domain